MTKYLLAAFLLACSLSADAQNLIWESGPGVRPQDTDLDVNVLSNWELSSDFDADGFDDIITSGIYRDTLFFRLGLGDGSVKFFADDSFFSRSTKALGYLKIPDIPGAFQRPPVVFGNTSGNRIIAILIAVVSENSTSASFQELDPGSEFRLISINDLNQDGTSDFLIFNRDEKRLQAWQF